MTRIYRTAMTLLACGAAMVIVGCETVSTAGNYEPSNCAMVGSRCSSGR